MKVKEVSVHKYLNVRIYQSPFGFSIDQTDCIMKLVNEWFPNGNFRNFDTTFQTESLYEKELLAVITLPQDMPFIRHKCNIMENLNPHFEGYITLIL